jgi:predicted RNase H-like HicB family nuclease
MERLIKVHIEKLPEGVYLATSDDLQGLVAQGRTMTETLEIARDVARRLIEAQDERQPATVMPPSIESADLTLVVGA